MTKKLAIVQSNYIPWKGYFDLIRSVDEFVLYDDMQFTRRDWRNRNKIKTAHGTKWLTIPVKVKGRYFQKIKDTEVSNPDWSNHHWRMLATTYARAKCFQEYAKAFEQLYSALNDERLSQINYRLIVEICRILNIKTKISWSMDYELGDGKTEKLIQICRQAGATHYLSGPTARAYMEESLFEETNIDLHYVDYSGYQPYEQLHPPFEHGVTILDLIFNVGTDASHYLKSL